jgi:hypothetical protein
MTSNQRSPLWPYMLVLSGLFVLTLALPRGWRDDADSADGHTGSLARRRANLSKLDAPVAIVRATGNSAADMQTGPMPSDFNWSSASGELQSRGANDRQVADAANSNFGSPNINCAGDSTPSMGIAETVAKKIADLREYGIANLLPKSKPAAGNLTPAAVPETPGLTDVAGWRAASQQSPTRHGSRTRKGPENPGQTLLLPKMCAERART